MKSATFFRGAVLVGLLLAAGCEVTAENIKSWKETEKGPKKIRSALADRRTRAEVRVEAVAALAELGMVAELTEDVGGLGASERQALAAASEGRLLAMMRGAAPGGTTDLQLRAKDVLSLLRADLAAATRERVDVALARWLLADWGRRRTGEASGEKVVLAIGTKAGPELAQHLTDSAEYLAELAEVLGKVGDVAAREAGARKLVLLAKTEASRRRAWLEPLGKLRTSIGRSFLAGLARRGDAEERALAIQALGSAHDEGELPLLARVASDAKEPGAVREAAFAALERLGGPRVMDALAGFLVASNETVRYRSAEALVACCKVKGVAKLLDALPSGYAYKRQDVADYLEKDIRELGTSVLPVLRQALKAKSWIARLVAVRVLSELGAKEDLPRLEALSADPTALLGWGPGATLGKEARAAAERLRQRN